MVLILCRCSLLEIDGRILPASIVIHGLAIQSQELMEEVRVLDNKRTLDFNIAKFINRYQVNTVGALDPGMYNGCVSFG